jgi:histidine triad (HIT) family protein
MAANDTSDCIFCKIVAGKIPSFKVYEDDRALAFMDINPVAPGHTLVIPKNHAENLMALTPGDLAGVHQASQKVAAAMMKTLEPGGIAVLQLNGKGANQIVMHYHVHLIPRDKEKDGLSLFDWEPVQGDFGRIEKISEKIKLGL